MYILVCLFRFVLFFNNRIIPIFQRTQTACATAVVWAITSGYLLWPWLVDHHGGDCQVEFCLSQRSQTWVFQSYLGMSGLNMEVWTHGHPEFVPFEIVTWTDCCPKGTVASSRVLSLKQWLLLGQNCAKWFVVTEPAWNDSSIMLP